MGQLLVAHVVHIIHTYLGILAYSKYSHITRTLCTPPACEADQRLTSFVGDQWPEAIARGNGRMHQRREPQSKLKQKDNPLRVTPNDGKYENKKSDIMKTPKRQHCFCDVSQS